MTLLKFIGRELDGIVMRVNDLKVQKRYYSYVFTVGEVVKDYQCTLDDEFTATYSNLNNLSNLSYVIRPKTNDIMPCADGIGNVADVAEVAVSEDLVDERSLEERVLAEIPVGAGVRVSSLVEQFGGEVFPAIERLKEKGAVYEPEVGVLRKGI